MSDLMKARAVMAKKLNVMVRKIEGVSLFVLTGHDEYTPGEIFFVVAAADDAVLPKAISDLNFLIREFLRPTDIQKSEADNRTSVNYEFENGLKAQVVFCNENNLPSFEWWVPYLDKNGAAMGCYSPSSRKNADPTTDQPKPESEFSDDFEDDFDDTSADTADEPGATAEPQPEPEPEVAPEPVVPAPVVAAAPAPVHEPEKEKPDRDIWNYFYGRVNVAKHAISGGSSIYACEIMGELRTLLIKLICEANGITEDYMHSIDLLPENHRAALLKTYPSKIENGPMISALAAELSIFEELMKRSSR